MPILAKGIVIVNSTSAKTMVILGWLGLAAVAAAALVQKHRRSIDSLSSRLEPTHPQNPNYSQTGT